MTGRKQKEQSIKFNAVGAQALSRYTDVFAAETTLLMRIRRLVSVWLIYAHPIGERAVAKKKKKQKINKNE